jgi:hypothetical protein
MSDKTKTDYQKSDDAAAMPEKFADNGDGSYSQAVRGVGYRSAPTVTRPANATAYSAGDVVGGSLPSSSRSSARPAGTFW